MASVLLKHLGKTYPNGTRAVDDFNLEIADGELVVLVGPSGCGKSTTLRMIAGLEEATCGEIYIGDRIVNRVVPRDRDIAMVFQNYALYPHLSVRANLAFGLKMRRTPRVEIERRVKEAAAILSIECLLDRLPRELSGGQRQRVALGRAIVREPKVFLFDEPLSNLDAKLRLQMRAEIRRLHQRLKATVIYVTHDQAEAMTLGDRIVLMDYGMIQQVDTPMNIYSRPANRFAASFIGNPAMNFIPGEVKDGVFRLAASNSDGIPTGPGVEVGRTIPDGPAFLGIRPEDVSLQGNGVPFGTVSLDIVERMGHETIAHCILAGAEQIARLSADATVQPGDQLQFSILPSACQLFSATDGRRLN
ncbi:MAG: sn-glycerol-3-phosphate ABC transporter ATP-binding protein UgpC [Pirellulales bacterium]